MVDSDVMGVITMQQSSSYHVMSDLRAHDVSGASPSVPGKQAAIPIAQHGIFAWSVGHDMEFLRKDGIAGSAMVNTHAAVCLCNFFRSK